MALIGISGIGIYNLATPRSSESDSKQDRSQWLFIETNYPAITSPQKYTDVVGL